MVIEALEIPDCLRGRLVVDVKTAAEVLGVGLNQAYRAAAAGEIPSLRIQGRLLIPVRPLLELLGAGALDEERRDAADPHAA